MHAPDTRMLRAEEVAVRYQLTRNSVYELARQGVLPCVRIRRLVRFDPRMLDSFDERGGFTHCEEGALSHA